MKNYIGISRDHSGSMAGLTRTAVKDYNANIDSIKEGAATHSIDTVVSVIKCGVNPTSSAKFAYYGTRGGGSSINEFEVVNSSVNSLKHLTTYEATGHSTPLFDSIGDLIEQLEKVPDAKNDDVSFLIMAITDGAENSSQKYTATSISKKIKELQKTDRWTFVFRVPKGYKTNLVRLGIPDGNILEWETTERGLEASTIQTQAATMQYYAARSTGVRGSTRFYSDLHNVALKDVAKKLDEVKGTLTWKVDADSEIRNFVEGKLGHAMKLGSAFYQLTKPEKIQGHKDICIRHKYSGKIYSGDAARGLLGIPSGGEVKVYPGNHGDYDVFVQSTSTNRKLLAGTELLYLG